MKTPERIQKSFFIHRDQLAKVDKIVKESRIEISRNKAFALLLDLGIESYGKLYGKINKA